MSRAPKVENTYTPLHASLGSRDVIDFVDNSLQTLAPGVMGGPPAYLEAHGIRYVPSTEMSSNADGVVPMSTSLEPDPSRDRPGLNSRIREFLQSDAGALRDVPASMRAIPPLSRFRTPRPCASEDSSLRHHSSSIHDSPYHLPDSSPHSIRDVPYHLPDPPSRSIRDAPYRSSRDSSLPHDHGMDAMAASRFHRMRTEQLLGELRQSTPPVSRSSAPSRPLSARLPTVASRMAGCDY
jgi:hypothetical protein